MTAVTQPRRVSAASVWLQWAAALALLLGLASLLLLAAGPLGWRAGWWHYRVAFRDLMPWAFYCAVAATGLGAVTLGIGLRRLRRTALLTVLLALALGAAVAYVPWHYDQLRGTGPNDITTDLDNPPAYVAVLTLRRAENAQNPGEYKISKGEQQRRAYPDIKPVMLNVPPDEAFARALATAEHLGWSIVAKDPRTGRIEASERSRWFGFTDDIVIRVTPNGGGSRVDVRSSSRLGNGDFGVNAARVRRYLAALAGSAS